MNKSVAAMTVEEYLASVPEKHKEIIFFFHDFIRNTAPALNSHFAYNMLGYGSFKYKNYKKEIIDWPLIALANQKNYISIYVCAVVGGQYLPEAYQEQLGKVSVGKSCIRIKKIEDVNLPVLKKMIIAASKSTGLAYKPNSSST